MQTRLQPATCAVLIRKQQELIKGAGLILSWSLKEDSENPHNKMETGEGQVSKMALFFLAHLVAGMLPVAGSSDLSLGWCYNFPLCSESTWPSIPDSYCSGNHQSPINIVTADVQADVNLTSFNFTSYDDGTVMTEIINTGRDVKVTLNEENMIVEGGALPGIYHSKQFHLHWGNGSSMPGSEHTINGKRFSMELHIVNVKAGYNSTLSALKDPTGVAVLGFFLEATNDTSTLKSWKTLTSYLANISNAGDQVAITKHITMDDLLEGVDLTKYYRYLGSLTTPPCNEAVVWTIFKDPIKVSPDLMDLFSTSVYFNKNETSQRIINNFRHTLAMNDRVVTSQDGNARTNRLTNSADIRLYNMHLITAALLYILWVLTTCMYTL